MQRAATLIRSANDWTYYRGCARSCKTPTGTRHTCRCWSHAHTHADAHAHTRARARARTRTQHTRARARTHTRMHSRTQTHAHKSSPTPTPTPTYTRTHARTRTDTHAHTRTQAAAHRVGLRTSQASAVEAAAALVRVCACMSASVRVLACACVCACMSARARARVCVCARPFFTRGCEAYARSIAHRRKAHLYEIFGDDIPLRCRCAVLARLRMVPIRRAELQHGVLWCNLLRRGMPCCNMLRCSYSVRSGASLNNQAQRSGSRFGRARTRRADGRTLACVLTPAALLHTITSLPRTRRSPIAHQEARRTRHQLPARSLPDTRGTSSSRKVNAHQQGDCANRSLGSRHVIA
jgi:hypothetical protein